MERFADINTGEIVKNLYMIDGVVKQISYRERNFIIKDTGKGLTELVLYDKPFMVPEHTILDNDFLTTHDELVAFKSYSSKCRWWKDENGVSHAIDERGTLAEFIKMYKRGSKRAIKTFYDYALSNTWDYFVTLTFKEGDIRNNRKMMYEVWRLFVKKLQNKFSDLKSIATFEEFEKGGYHLHAMLSDVDLTLVPARNNKKFFDKEETKPNPMYKKFIFSEFGQQVFNCVDWKLGFNTVTCLSPESNNAQVVNYMSKYMNKCCPANLHDKRFYKTQNLEARDTITGNSETDVNVDELLNRFGLYLAKIDKAGNQYFRNYGRQIEIKK